jgi:hypothetical protein
MESEILQWISNNLNKWLVSPRKVAFNPRRIKEFMLMEPLNDSVLIKFKDSKSPEFKLFFWMFDRTISHLESGEKAPIGAAVRPPYRPGSVEEAIWRKPYPLEKSPYKVSSHVCDILSLSGWIDFVYVKNLETGNDLQGVLLKQEKIWNPQSILVEKENFLKRYEKTIRVWTGGNKYKLTRERINYRINNQPTKKSIESRNILAKNIVLSRIKNQGGLDLDTVDAVMKWAGYQAFPLRDEIDVLDSTSRAFHRLDLGDIVGAVEILLSINGVNISIASHLIGLFDQYRYAIFDNRIGNALRSLQYSGERIIKCPPGSNQLGDKLSNSGWAKNYVYLIWTLWVICDRMNEEGVLFNIADAEMALSAIGESS